MLYVYFACLYPSCRIRTSSYRTRARARTHTHTEGGSGGRVNIFGDDSIGHWEKKSSYQHGV